MAITSGLLARGVAFLTPLIVMPAMFNHLGESLFGIWLTAVSVSAMATFLDFGIGNAVLTRLSRALGSDDCANARSILGQSYVLLASISFFLIIFVLVGVVIAWFFCAEGSSCFQQANIIALVLISLFITFPTSVIMRLLQARHAYVYLAFLQSSAPLAALILSLAGIAMGLGPIVVIALYTMAVPSVQLIWTIVYFLMNAKTRPAFDLLGFRSMQKLLGLGGAFFSVSILTAIGMNLDNLVIAAGAGPTIVAEFGVPAKLGAMLMLIVFTMFMPLWSLFGDAIARRDRDWLAKMLFRTSSLGSLVIIAVGSGIVVFADQIIGLWMGRSFTDQKAILMGMVMVAGLVAVTSPFNMVLNAAGMAREQILPWAAFVAATATTKMLIVGPQVAWYMPWVTAFFYGVIIMPRMILLTIRYIKTIPDNK
ncbi:oligosaccharide flippase family protein [Halomonas sp. 25-S5]|uniref:lipopolysaccharide biosynthesis protein n=1 Tax=Halomonas sp. 25-S5 TaxID=2994065 RepID=UPI0024694A9B|nr:oligosaccharide flippase family protein [Halomonas sp. 25-S5]